MTIDLRRAFDLSYDYQTAAPLDQRWSVIDINSYDGAPDAEGCSHFMGRGATKKEALMDLLDQFAEYDERPAPRRSIQVFSSREEPPEFIDLPYKDPDEAYDERTGD